MLTLGLSGGLDLVHQDRDHLFPRGSCHDSAAALVDDGQVIAALEEERLNRIKHSSKGAVGAIRFCLGFRFLSLADIDRVCFYGSEATCTRLLVNLFYGSVDAAPVTTPRELILDLLQESTGDRLDDRKLMFVDHHLAHAASAFLQSGLPESLVLTMDGIGDNLSGSVSYWRGPSYVVLRTFSAGQSLGILYDRIIAMIGYGFTEEYKVMGLAPYGNAARYHDAFAQLYNLLPGGDYSINWDAIEALYSLAPVRKPGEPIRQEHVDIAAGLQESLERIVFHVAGHYRKVTGLLSLCYAGGVAQNSTLNGKLLCSGMFQDVFVHPASYDAGCAVGAALIPQKTAVTALSLPGAAPAGQAVGRRIESVYWGTDIGSDDQAAATLHRWRAFLDIERVDRIGSRGAAALAAGHVLGWVQGRSEFGPRALGNRSIVADPRPAENKDLINKMIKKREGYRPFAPSVLEEYASDYFQIPSRDMRFPFMSFTVPVRPSYRDILGATTHVDGSARIHTVSRTTNPRFWELIDEFRKLTSVPVVLNTSFNNNVEPIVDSVDDAVICFLTTGLSRLIVGNCFVAKKKVTDRCLLGLGVSLPPYGRLVKEKALSKSGSHEVVYKLQDSFSDRSLPVSECVAELLFASGGDRPASEYLRAGHDGEAVGRELRELWSQRAITLYPVGA